MYAVIKNIGRFAWLALAVAYSVFYGCEPAGAELSAEGGSSQDAGGVLALRGLTAGNAYLAEVYAYSGAGITDAAAWAEVTENAAGKAAAGAGKAAGRTADVPLESAAGGGPFTRTGTFLVAVTETSAVSQSSIMRFKAAVTFVGGKASLSWTDMGSVPAEDGGQDPSAAFRLVSFDCGGGSPVPSLLVPSGEKARRPSDPTRKDAAFAGWFTDSALTVPYNFDSAVAEGLILFAKWTEAAAFTVSFDSRGGSEVTPSYVPAGGTASRPVNPTKKDAAFAGWYSDSALTVPYSFGSAVTADLTLFAKWTDAATRSLSFDSSLGSPVPTAYVPLGGTASPPPDPALAAYAFSGWHTRTGQLYSFDSQVNDNLTLFAKWRKFHTVRFDSRNGETPVSALIPMGYLVNRPADPVMTGYVFGGWFTDAEGVSEADFAAPVSADANYYAKWTPVYVTVRFDSRGGGAVSPQETLWGGMAGIPDTPVRGGYSFGGWYADAGITVPYDFGASVTEDITVYARWSGATTFSGVLSDMAVGKGAANSSYRMVGGTETYLGAVVLDALANSPRDVVIDGGGRLIIGKSNRVTVGSGVTLTLRNIGFEAVPFTVASGGRLILDLGAVISGNVYSAALAGDAEARRTGTGVTAAGGALEIRYGARVTGNTHSGVRVCAGGSLVMSGGEITDNRVNAQASDVSAVYSGGGAAVEEGGAFTLTGGKISGNTAEGSGTGGGVSAAGGAFTMSGGEVSGNGARDGGGIAVSGAGGAFTLTAGTVSGNTAQAAGGGVHASRSARFTMSGGRIGGNEALSGGNRLAAGGGGVYVGYEADFTMSGGEVSGNEAYSTGGGVYADYAYGGSLSVSPPAVIAGNTPDDTN
jgi:uncharacterized repeat protein (TIGR02543 family)